MNNNILIAAEGIDGANFLAACLTMSDEVYFNNSSLDDKIIFFFTGMSKVSKKNGLPVWSDVSMLFSNCHRVRSKLIFQTYQSKKLYESLKFSLNGKSLISKVAMPQPWPLKALRSKNPDDPLLNLFESRYFIGIINPDLFISLRMVLDDRDFVDPEIPNLDLFTIEKFNSLSKEEKDRIQNFYKSDIVRLFKFQRDIPTIHAWNMYDMECDVDYTKENKNEKIQMKDISEKFFNESRDLLEHKITHQWDCNWFLSEDDTIDGIKLFYDQMNLGKVNTELIRSMYKAWIGRINYIKNSHIIEFRLLDKSTINNSAHL